VRRAVFFEMARLVTLLSSMLSLYAVFHTAFLVPSLDLRQKIYDSLALLMLAALLSTISGLFFLHHSRDQYIPRHAEDGRLLATLPVRVFLWASTTMLVLFVLAWYLETYCVFYRDVRF
jgi:hypothetical protein